MDRAFSKLRTHKLAPIRSTRHTATIALPVGKEVAAGLEFRLHRDRRPDVRFKLRPHIFEVGRRNADHGERMSIQRQRFAQNAGVRAQTLLPELVTENDDRIVTGTDVFVRQKPASHERAYTQ